MVILSTAATVIALQALITGVFSLSRQAVQLGFTETPSVPELLATLTVAASLDRTYYLSDRASTRRPLGRWVRSAQFFGIPDGQIVTLSNHMDL